MLDPDKIQTARSIANELNNLLHVISESSKGLESFCPGAPEANRYFAMLRSAVDRATKVAGEMVDRIAGVEGELEPIAPKPSAEPKHTPAPGVCVFNPGGPRELLLMVDDEEYITALGQEMLAEGGYRVITANDGFEALELYRKMHSEIALVLLDFTMPVMDGADVFHELRQINPAAAVVLSSGFTEHDRLRGMLAHGLRGFIPKPYTKQKLLDQIRTTLDGIEADRGSVPKN
jgi:CheY-like chemotaxis protein